MRRCSSPHQMLVPKACSVSTPAIPRGLCSPSRTRRRRTGPAKSRKSTLAIFYAPWRDAVGKPVVEQFKISGLDGSDKIGFLPSVDFSVLAQRSDDWVGVFDGGAGDDVLLGSGGRDLLDGGPDHDILYGFAGDDRLWGGPGNDVLFAGQGNDDLLGGEGK